MPKAIEFMSEHLPAVTVRDVQRFANSIEIRDAKAFAAQLQAFFQERLAAAKLSMPNPAVDAASQPLVSKAAALRADTRWTPSETDIQRGRAMLLQTFKQPHNLSPADFAKLADKSRQQIYKDIAARKLLTLKVGPQRQRLPDWQLDPVKQQLTQAALEQLPGIDHWSLYRALSEPLEGLGGRSPVAAVTPETLQSVLEAVCNALGVQAR
ncbi:integrase [Vandammella animalimorsus]|uniref:Integrase n=1 Tax=Vandammella animalimorsus TaxID=2029117 RepID=A0A2A2T5C8_9BURK|nr:integrase [Vandammella animalimorsus]PAT30889.1 integrase [Vandammella animalimorsus]PAX16780.1 integrase [Vandammella animalimorsus]PAX20422.1 integrase [Vandammella animalimorsus]